MALFKEKYLLPVQLFSSFVFAEKQYVTFPGR